MVGVVGAGVGRVGDGWAGGVRSAPTPIATAIPARTTRMARLAPAAVREAARRVRVAFRSADSGQLLRDTSCRRCPARWSRSDTVLSLGLVGGHHEHGQCLPPPREARLDGADRDASLG